MNAGNNFNQELDFKVWDDYIRGLHDKMEEIGNTAQEMFYNSGQINIVCSNLLVFYSKNSSYLAPEKKLKERIRKVYELIHSSVYVGAANIKLSGKPSPYFDTTKNNAIFELLDIIEEINKDLADGELNPKPKIVKPKESELEMDPEKKAELQAMEILMDN